MPQSSRPRAASHDSEEPLLPTDNVHDCGCNILVEYYEKRHKALQRVLIIQWIAIVFLVFGIVLVLLSRSNDGIHWIPNELYSPAKDAIRYETKVFSHGFGGDKSEYMGPPTQENILAWDRLYQAGISMIPHEQAAQLPVKTAAIPEEPGYYVVGLDVFHQLHCLNHIRLKLWAYHDNSAIPTSSAAFNASQTGSSQEKESGNLGIEHLDHCVDSIRQSLMCSSDISTVVWAWDESRQMTLPLANVTHTCRDFEAIRQWAGMRQASDWDRGVDPSRL
ncbi:hypothetical protein P168DRAFT_286080 [Aspergillus campestris IBT 28561]|uniref:Tat pathway signal sequence n=1 Tax=Aspergillus campestris (strain IBT 28561) TaxID=1392248 RepID=A0A2I1DDE9_ASPC2|nr:uncharacterized protein P168DRAFT_286080 [Aspergillus campestris IBT 28561]PKY07907.1 hypothetical protein P168DRAFT_286080 [Aspergillus campestris IBT 28561]